MVIFMYISKIQAAKMSLERLNPLVKDILPLVIMNMKHSNLIQKTKKFLDNGGNARDKWIRGCFCCVIHNLLILFEQEIGVS